LKRDLLFILITYFDPQLKQTMESAVFFDK